jgi:hypothetical protein
VAQGSVLARVIGRSFEVLGGHLHVPSLHQHPREIVKPVEPIEDVERTPPVAVDPPVGHQDDRPTMGPVLVVVEDVHANPVLIPLLLDFRNFVIGVTRGTTATTDPLYCCCFSFLVPSS